MKLQTLFICSLLVLGAFATSEEEEVASTITQIESSQFGKTMMQTIQLQLQSNEPISDLIDLLKDIESNLVAEQKSDDASMKEFRDSCFDDEDRLNTEITSTSNRIEELTEELAEKIPTRDEKNVLLEQRVEQASDIVDAITELDDEKEERDSDWQEVAAEHDRATFVIESAKQFLDRGFAGFLEKSEGNNVFAQLSNHFTKSADLKFKRHSWTSLFKLLAQITASAPVQAQRESINKILDLCDNLLEKIADSREIERREYDSWVQRYNEDKSRLVDQLADTQAQISQLQAEISALSKRIEMAKDEKEEQQNRLKQKSAELGDRTIECDDAGEAYADRRTARQEDLQTVGQCIGLIESKIRILRQFVAQRLG